MNKVEEYLEGLIKKDTKELDNIEQVLCRIYLDWKDRANSDNLLMLGFMDLEVLVKELNKDTMIYNGFIIEELKQRFIRVKATLTMYYNKAMMYHSLLNHYRNIDIDKTNMNIRVYYDKYIKYVTYFVLDGIDFTDIDDLEELSEYANKEAML